MTATDARLRLLEAAEPLFRDLDYEAVSVRAVNKAAGMNPAAVHYHFGSKEALATALLEHRMDAAWAAPLTALDGLASGGSPPTPECIALLLVEPMARLAADPDRRWLLRLLARLVRSGHPLPWHSPWSSPERWRDLLSRALPGLAPEEAAVRWRLARDLVLHVYGAASEPPPPTPAVTAFVTAGLASPPP